MRTKPYIYMMYARAVTQPGEIVRMTLLGSAFSAVLMWLFGTIDFVLLLGFIIGGLNAALYVHSNVRRR